VPQPETPVPTAAAHHSRQAAQQIQQCRPDSGDQETQDVNNQGVDDQDMDNDTFGNVGVRLKIINRYSL
jgi:hypothetical protein